MNKPGQTLATLELMAAMTAAGRGDTVGHYTDDVKPSRVRATRGKKANRKREQATRRKNRG